MTIVVFLPESWQTDIDDTLVAECLRMQRPSLDERRQSNWKVIIAVLMRCV